MLKACALLAKSVGKLHRQRSMKIEKEIEKMKSYEELIVECGLLEIKGK